MIIDNIDKNKQPKSMVLELEIDYNREKRKPRSLAYSVGFCFEEQKALVWL